MNKNILRLIVLTTLSGSANQALAEKTKQQWIDEATQAAIEIFERYHTICDGRVTVRAAQHSYYQFSASTPKVEVFGLYRLSDAEKLNGKLWTGKIVVNMGESARNIVISPSSEPKLSPWNYGREAEFDLEFNKGKWTLVGKILSYSTDSFTLQPNVSCTN
ncbi:MAG TPA: hypothetical protein VL995_20765 [Cellvibrio sp.]|nr:hypothetical protein [Cellvibrio sp.]